MDKNAIFGLGILMSFIASGLVAKLYVVPRLRVRHGADALIPLVIPHTFRFAGLSFLVPGVVSPSLPPAFTVSAAYGDLIAAILAIVATLALNARASWAVAIVWLFNVWGTADLLHAMYRGAMGIGDPGLLGAAYYIPTVIVPMLLVAHALLFWVLLRPKQS